MIEITKDNQSKVLCKLKENGKTVLADDISKQLQINEEYYSDTEFNTDNGYGCKIFLIDNISDYIKLKQKMNIIKWSIEHEQVIYEENHEEMTLFNLYLIGSDSAVVFYLIG